MFIKVPTEIEILESVWVSLSFLLQEVRLFFFIFLFFLDFFSQTDSTFAGELKKRPKHQILQHMTQQKRQPKSTHEPVSRITDK